MLRVRIPSVPFAYVPWLFEGLTLLLFIHQEHMTFKFILESQLNEGKFTFVTVEDCIDMDDAINHIHCEFPTHTIDQITEVSA